MNSDKTIRTALKANAAFCASGGLVALGGAWVLSDPLGVPAPVLAAVGAVLIPYAALLLVWSRRRPFRRLEGWMAVAGDLAWVIGSALILGLGPGSLTTAGVWVVGLVGLVVLDFALAQIIGLRRLGSEVDDHAVVGDLETGLDDPS